MEELLGSTGRSFWQAEGEAVILQSSLKLSVSVSEMFLIILFHFGYVMMDETLSNQPLTITDGPNPRAERILWLKYLCFFAIRRQYVI